MPIKSIHRNYLFLLYESCIRKPYTHSFSEIVRTGVVILHPHIDITVDDAPLKTAVVSFNARCHWLISCYSDQGRAEPHLAPYARDMFARPWISLSVLIESVSRK